MIDFFPIEHIASSSKRKFGICDRPAPAANNGNHADHRRCQSLHVIDVGGYLISCNKRHAQAFRCMPPV